MKTGTVDLAESVIIPEEGYFKCNGKVTSVQLFSADLSEASIAVELQGSLDGERWDTLQESGSDISETLASGVALVRSFEVDNDLLLRFSCGSATGTVEYLIVE